MVDGRWWDDEMVSYEMTKNEKYVISSSTISSQLTISHLKPCSVGGSLTDEGKTKKRWEMRDGRWWDDKNDNQPSHDLSSYLKHMMIFSPHIPSYQDEMRWDGWWRDEMVDCGWDGKWDEKYHLISSLIISHLWCNLWPFSINLSSPISFLHFSTNLSIT